ncbi:MAG: GntR family transcriptional regulator [Lachnospiraceae bacterium]|nr:GntR family transcriptional regulator [Lachnospiraceae bacterium]
MIQIDYKDSRPIYEQIVEKFKNLILKGVLTTDEKLPSVRSLALELAINPNTIQKAYAQLERDGFIYTVKGRGNFVAEKEDLVMEKKEEILAELRQLLLMAKEVGIQKEELLALFQSLGEK